MRGIPPSAALPASDLQLGILEKEYRKVNNLVSFRERVGIILWGIRGISNYQTTKDLGVSLTKVKQWRRRWEEGWEGLCAEEMDAEGEVQRNHLILTKIKEVLLDKPRSGAPKRFTLAQEQQIVALACDKPEKYDIPITNWTQEMLAHVAKTKKIVDSISSSQIGNILKKTN